ncbi:MAG: hypothetical protein QE271_11080 [Bacteriovoracaceae bacterium]|nr:hypothetical protein [Bacteriovoracaceae bacterium]
MQSKIILTISFFILFFATSGCGNKKSSSNVPNFSNSLIACNPAFGNNCNIQGVNGLNSQLYTFPTDMDAMRSKFEAAAFPGEVGPRDFLNFYSPSQGRVESHLFFNGRLIFGSNLKDQEKYVFVNFQSNDLVINKYYPLKYKSDKVRETLYRSKEDIINKIFDNGLGTQVEAFKVCYQTQEKGSLPAVLVRRVTRQGFVGGQITSQVVAILPDTKAPLAINPVYSESYNPYRQIWEYDLLMNARIGGQTLTAKLDQSNFQQQNFPIVGCQY